MWWQTTDCVCSVELCQYLPWQLPALTAMMAPVCSEMFRHSSPHDDYGRISSRLRGKFNLGRLCLLLQESIRKWPAVGAWSDPSSGGVRTGNLARDSTGTRIPCQAAGSATLLIPACSDCGASRGTGGEFRLGKYLMTLTYRHVGSQRGGGGRNQSLQPTVNLSYTNI